MKRAKKEKRRVFWQRLEEDRRDMRDMTHEERVQWWAEHRKEGR
jgi:hypothetical protein